MPNHQAGSQFNVETGMIICWKINHRPAIMYCVGNNNCVRTPRPWPTALSEGAQQGFGGGQMSHVTRSLLMSHALKKKRTGICWDTGSHSFIAWSALIAGQETQFCYIFVRIAHVGGNWWKHRGKRDRFHQTEIHLLCGIRHTESRDLF